VINATALDSIIRKALQSFYTDISASAWCGREREMVSFFVFSHIAPLCFPNSPLHLGQIGIEVAVRQLERDDLNPKRRPDVCKDLVIWPAPKMTLWTDWNRCNEPIAIMEWKVNHRFNMQQHIETIEDSQDLDWLRQTAKRIGPSRTFLGYAVFVETECAPNRLSYVKVSMGAPDERISFPLSDQSTVSSGVRIPIVPDCGE